MGGSPGGSVLGELWKSLGESPGEEPCGGALGEEPQGSPGRAIGELGRRGALAGGLWGSPGGEARVAFTCTYVGILVWGV